MCKLSPLGLCPVRHCILVSQHHQHQARPLQAGRPFRLGLARAAETAVQASAADLASESRWAEHLSSSPSNSMTGGSSIINISSHFDSGNIDVEDVLESSSAGQPHVVKLRIHADPFCDLDQKAHFQFYYFRASGSKGHALELQIVNAGEASYAHGFRDYKSCASYDRKFWFRVPTEFDESTGILTIKHTPARDAVWYAYWAPFSQHLHADLIARMQNKDCVSLVHLGYTLDGNDLDLLRIGEPAAGKRNVWVIARQHPGETMAEWAVQGFLERLTDGADALSRQTLSRATFYVVPNVNPDGSWRGHLRTNAVGVNLNREWQDPCIDRSPEVLFVRNLMDEVGVDMLVDVHGDEALPYCFISGNEGIPAWGPRLKGLQDQFCDAFVKACPDFQTKHGYGISKPGTANMKICAHAIGERFDCLAMTLELPFKDTIETPNEVQGWSPERSMHLGASMLNPIAEVIPNLR